MKSQLTVDITLQLNLEKPSYDTYQAAAGNDDDDDDQPDSKKAKKADKNNKGIAWAMLKFQRKKGPVFHVLPSDQHRIGQDQGDSNPSSSSSSSSDSD